MGLRSKIWGWKGTGGCDPLPEVIQMTWMIILRVERI